MQTIYPEQYPPLLKEIRNIPDKLYIEGQLPPPDTKYLCVVGARNHTSYGKAACIDLIKGLAGYNICIVSGLAIGIDGVAHEAALDAGLTTIAFPGSGLADDVLYPAQHHRLAERILEQGGALISPFEPHFNAAPWSFPERNELMAGTSHATLVIEAKERSGTSITARRALDFSRDVMIVPGSMFSVFSRCTNELLKQGAIPVTSSADILEVLGIDPSSRARIEEKDLNLNSLERTILGTLREPLERGELIHILCDKSGDGPETYVRENGKPPSVSEIHQALSTLEIKALIIEDRGTLFAKQIHSV